MSETCSSKAQSKRETLPKRVSCAKHFIDARHDVNTAMDSQILDEPQEDHLVNSRADGSISGDEGVSREINLRCRANRHEKEFRQ